MSNKSSTVYIGNLDRRVTDRVLYDILIQAGRVVNLQICIDKQTDRPKGYAFAEYETAEIADYAIELFSGLVKLYNRTLMFSIAGKDKATSNASMAITPTPNSSQRPRPYRAPTNNPELFLHPSRLSIPDRFGDCATNYSQVPPNRVTDQYSGYGSHHSGNEHQYSQRTFGAALDSISHASPRSRHPDIFSPPSDPSY